jgi:lipoprotein-releasing system permease protein
MRMARLGDDVSGIEIRTRDRWEAPEIARRLELALDGNFNYVEDWQTQNQALFSALKLEKLAMTIIVFLIVLVASFNIVSVLTMLVKDKTREIGILRAMGLRALSIRRVFLAQGIFIGLLGTSIGLIVGLATSISVGHYKLIPLDPSTYFIDYLPVRTEPLDVVLIALGSMLIALLATLNPSAQAARLYPLEAIRHE